MKIAAHAHGVSRDKTTAKQLHVAFECSTKTDIDFLKELFSYENVARAAAKAARVDILDGSRTVGYAGEVMQIGLAWAVQAQHLGANYLPAWTTLAKDPENTVPTDQPTRQMILDQFDAAWNTKWPTLLENLAKVQATSGSAAEDFAQIDSLLTDADIISAGDLVALGEQGLSMAQQRNTERDGQAQAFGDNDANMPPEMREMLHALFGGPDNLRTFVTQDTSKMN